MIISFDLDDTLIPGTGTFGTEKQTVLQRLLRLEKIRRGTKELFKELRAGGHSVNIYTTSFCSIAKIKFMFQLYGIPVDKVVNQQVHDKQLGENRRRSSKYPPAFGFEIHIDDSPGLRIEGLKYDFRTIIVAGSENDWNKKIVETVNQMER